MNAKYWYFLTVHLQETRHVLRRVSRETRHILRETGTCNLLLSGTVLKLHAMPGHAALHVHVQVQVYIMFLYGIL